MKNFFGFPPSQINPYINYEFLKEFLEENNYSFPILPLHLRKDENGIIMFDDDFPKMHTLPIEIVGSDNTEQLQALVWDIFNEKAILKKLEHEYI